MKIHRQGKITYVGLTVFLKAWNAETKVGYSEPRHSLLVRVLAVRQVTPGVTDLSRARVHIDLAV